MFHVVPSLFFFVYKQKSAEAKKASRLNNSERSRILVVGLRSSFCSDFSLPLRDSISRVRHYRASAVIVDTTNRLLGALAELLLARWDERFYYNACALRLQSGTLTKQSQFHRRCLLCKHH